MRVLFHVPYEDDASSDDGCGCDGARYEVGARVALRPSEVPAAWKSPDWQSPRIFAGMDDGRCFDLMEEINIDSADQSYLYKAVNNAQMAAWVNGVLWATWRTEGGAVKVGVFDSGPRTWQTVESSSACDRGGDAPYALYNPVLSVSNNEVTVAWLEQFADMSVQVCGVRNLTTPLSFTTRARRLLWNLRNLGGTLFPDFRDMGALYPSLSAVDDGVYVALTDRSADGPAGPLEFDAADNMARAAFAGSGGDMELAEALAYDRDAGSFETTSDPSVASAANGSLTVFAWEERSASMMTKYIMYMAIDHVAGGRVDGPFPIWVGGSGDLATDGTAGGDPSVLVLPSAVFVAHQGTSAGSTIRVCRTRRRAGGFGAATTWTALELEDGWLPAIAGIRHPSGDELVAVAWEQNGAGLTENGNKEVVMAHLRFSGGVGTIEAIVRLGTPVHAGDSRRFQLCPSITVGVDAVGDVVVDVFWYDVDAGGGLARCRLVHATYRFGETNCVR